MYRFAVRTRFCSALLAISLLATMGAVGCNDSGGGSGGGGGTSGGGEPQLLSMGTAPIGGAFNVVGGELCETLNNAKGENNWKLQTSATKGSQENIRRLQNAELELGLSNAAITYFAVRGEGAWDQEYDVRTIVTIAPNIAMFITKESSDIQTIADLKGKRVVCGPAGAGFDMFIGPILKAHGISFDDFDKKLNNTQTGAVDMLADGQADAAFLGGAVPTAAVQRACSELDIRFVAFDEAAIDSLVADYPFFQRFTLKAGAYGDLEEDFSGMNVGNMHVITSTDEPEERIYQLTKILYENRESINHGAAKFINPDNAARDTGTPFHPGAQRFYEEIGIWKGESNSESEPTETDEAANDPKGGESDDSDKDGETDDSDAESTEES